MPGKKWSVERERELIELWADEPQRIADRQAHGRLCQRQGRRTELHPRQGDAARAPHRKLKKTPEELAQAKADRIAAKRQHELVRQQALAAEREQKRISDAFAKLLKVEMINEERKQSSTPVR
jgi:hypothetical protein